jgi:glutathione S-transferase
MTMPILYSGTKNASSWAMRAWLALRASGFEFIEEVVDIRRPQRFRGLERIGTFSPSATVPALMLDGVVIFDSLAIMEFANEFASGRLLPTAPIARAQARSIVAWQHAGLSAICSRISFESSFYTAKRPLTLAEEGECARLLAFLETMLLRSGGPFLFGPVSLADFALAPTVVRLSRHQAPTRPFPAVALWMEALLDHALVIEWLAEADTLPQIWFDDYPVPGEPWREVTEADASHLMAAETRRSGRGNATDIDPDQVERPMLNARFA